MRPMYSDVPFEESSTPCRRCGGPVTIAFQDRMTAGLNLNVYYAAVLLCTCQRCGAKILTRTKDQEAAREAR